MIVNQDEEQVVHLHKRGYSVAVIVMRLEEEICQSGRLYKLLQRYRERGSVGDRALRPRSAKLDHEHLDFIDSAMMMSFHRDSYIVHQLLEDRWQGLRVSLQTVYNRT